ncbi:DUF3426 domain-containing protein [Simplicispira psychrophila]|uniref:DUF3426 domain-containing protein n=1 Tax=Simplicispira psychrophila TaxID=80882 RepID=UPI00068C02B5|nr:DUF3426 domain-containing protein [Simplicispira psychrophila]
MSQNTRCPSCATLFKVVADQLRISDGWVRCGQCQQIFDATAHLQEPLDPALLPDLELPLDSGRALPGAANADADVSQPVPGWEAAPNADGFPIFSELPRVAPVLDVPDPVVPGFLMVPASPQALAPAAGPRAADQLASATEAPEGPEPAEDEAAPVEPESSHTVLMAPEPLLPEPLRPGPVMATPLAGYELPSADLPEADFEWLADYETLESAPDTEPAPDFYVPFEAAPTDSSVPLVADPVDPADLPWMPSPTAPALERPPEPLPVSQKPPVLLAPPSQPLPPVSPSPDDSAGAEPEPAAEPLETPDWVTNLVRPPDPQRIEPVLHAYASDEPEPKGAAKAEEETDTELSPALPPSERPLEPSFVRSARRQAFWRQWEVRLALALLSLLLVVVLALQVALHQRNHLAAAQPQWRSFLQTLCVPLQCKVGPYRHISSIVIDSSSFNKVQGDAYQFAIALKNTSGNVLEIPAIELTLTDAQDQAVLRRVFTRKDLSAPRTLAAHGDWSANLQVQLTFDGAPIAGYRVLAFYP